MSEIYVSQEDFEDKYISRVIYDDARTLIAELRARIAELEAAAAWIPVYDDPPEDDTTVLVVDNGIVYQAIFSGGWCWDTVSHLPVDATHWRPLPAAPEAE